MGSWFVAAGTAPSTQAGWFQTPSLQGRKFNGETAGLQNRTWGFESLRPCQFWGVGARAA